MPTWRRSENNEIKKTLHSTKKPFRHWSVEILHAEMLQDEDTSEMAYLPDVGQWWPAKDVYEGDMHESNGLFARGTFQPASWNDIGPESRVIDAKVLR